MTSIPPLMTGTVFLNLVQQTLFTPPPEPEPIVEEITPPQVDSAQSLIAIASTLPPKELIDRTLNIIEEAIKTDLPAAQELLNTVLVYTSLRNNRFLRPLFQILPYRENIAQILKEAFEAPFEGFPCTFHEQILKFSAKPAYPPSHSHSISHFTSQKLINTDLSISKPEYDACASALTLIYHAKLPTLLQQHDEMILLSKLIHCAIRWNDSEHFILWFSQLHKTQIITDPQIVVGIIRALTKKGSYNKEFAESVAKAFLKCKIIACRDGFLHASLTRIHGALISYNTPSSVSLACKLLVTYEIHLPTIAWKDQLHLIATSKNRETSLTIIETFFLIVSERRVECLKECRQSIHEIVTLLKMPALTMPYLKLCIAALPQNEWKQALTNHLDSFIVRGNYGKRLTKPQLGVLIIFVQEHMSTALDEFTDEELHKYSLPRSLKKGCEHIASDINSPDLSRQIHNLWDTEQKALIVAHSFVHVQKLLDVIRNTRSSQDHLFIAERLFLVETPHANLEIAKQLLDAYQASLDASTKVKGPAVFNSKHFGELLLLLLYKNLDNETLECIKSCLQHSSITNALKDSSVRLKANRLLSNQINGHSIPTRFESLVMFFDEIKTAGSEKDEQKREIFVRTLCELIQETHKGRRSEELQIYASLPLEVVTYLRAKPLSKTARRQIFAICDSVVNELINSAEVFNFEAVKTLLTTVAKNKMVSQRKIYKLFIKFALTARKKQSHTTIVKAAIKEVQHAYSAPASRSLSQSVNDNLQSCVLDLLLYGTLPNKNGPFNHKNIKQEIHRAFALINPSFTNQPQQFYLTRKKEITITALKHHTHYQKLVDLQAHITQVLNEEKENNSRIDLAGMNERFFLHFVRASDFHEWSSLTSLLELYIEKDPIGYHLYMHHLSINIRMIVFNLTSATHTRPEMQKKIDILKNDLTTLASKYPAKNGVAKDLHNLINLLK